MKKTTITIGNKEVQILYIASIAIAVSGIFLLVWFLVEAGYFSKNSHVEMAEETEEEVQPACEFTRVLDGVCVGSEAEMNPHLYTVMIENHLDARPQSGLARAHVVYEAPVEANFSRFMALFLEGDSVGKIGPVRSARPYFLDWAQEFGKPMYVHVGGSPDALDRLKSATYFDFNEFYRGSYFWRSRDRYAPHNVYTSTELLSKGWGDYGVVSSTMSTATWKFGEVVPCTAICTTALTVSFNPPVYEALWKYASSSEKYFRYQLDEPHIDQDGTQIVADTIVVQHVNSQVLDAVLRIEMDTIGEGRAEVFTKGILIEGTWKKASRAEKTRFYDAQGNEIPFTPGKLWIEVVNERGGVVWE